MQEGWWYAEGDARKGPVSAENLKTLLLEDKIGGATLVWKQGMESWTPLAETAELQSLVQNLPPELPKISTAEPPPLPPELPVPGAAESARLPAGPWRRFFARQIDLWLIGLTLLYAAVFKLPGIVASDPEAASRGLYVLAFLLPLIALMIEALIYAVFGSTPGKALLGVSIMDGDRRVGAAQYFKRQFGVYWYGLGLCFPIFAPFTQIWQWRRLKTGRQTSYDEGQFNAQAPKLGPVRAIAATIVIVAIGYAYAVLNLAADNIGRIPSSVAGQAGEKTEPQQKTSEFSEVQKRAIRGDAEAQNKLGLMYAYGKGVPKDESKAVEWFRKAADQGDASAQFNLGLSYANGRGVPKDESKAVEWYRKAADQGVAAAQASLGLMYENGRGVPKDESKAVEWYRKAADQGHAGAQANLAGMYANGRGITKDETKAVEWLRKAADQGYASAQIILGNMYANGRGVPKDESKAVEWYRKAADQGHAKAQTSLGYMYATGRGVPEDESKAVEWYRKAADQGEAWAQNNLGVMYYYGQGVIRDRKKGCELYRLSAEQGNEKAIENYNRNCSQ